MFGLTWFKSNVGFADVYIKLHAGIKIQTQKIYSEDTCCHQLLFDFETEHTIAAVV